jgi:hypothetical protein
MPSTEINAAITWKVRVFRGEADIASPRPGQLRVRYSGACVAKHATAVTRLLDQWLEEGHEVRVVVDAIDLGCHAQGFERHWQGWLASNRARLETFEVMSLAPVGALSPARPAAAA